MHVIIHITDTGEIDRQAPCIAVSFIDGQCPLQILKCSGILGQFNVDVRHIAEMSCHAFHIAQLLICGQCALVILQRLRVVVLSFIHHPDVAKDQCNTAPIPPLPINAQCFAVILQCSSMVTKIQVHIPLAIAGHRYTESECNLVSLTQSLVGIVERSIIVAKMLVLTA
jgi:hypothetical protein